MLAGTYQTWAESYGLTAETNVTATHAQVGSQGIFLNGTRMVTDSKMCLASVDRCAMAKMMHLSPRLQMDAGIGALDVECGPGFGLVLKAYDASPACVTPAGHSKLVERGWALGDDEAARIRLFYEPGSQ